MKKIIITTIQVQMFLKHGMLKILKMVKLVYEKGMGMFNMVYIFNFCNINLSCHGVPVAVYEGLEVMGTITDNCDIVGLRYTKIVSHIPDKPKEYGISISFNDNS